MPKVAERELLVVEGRGFRYRNIERSFSRRRVHDVDSSLYMAVRRRAARRGRKASVLVRIRTAVQTNYSFKSERRSRGHGIEVYARFLQPQRRRGRAARRSHWSGWLTGGLNCIRTQCVRCLDHTDEMRVELDPWPLPWTQVRDVARVAKATCAISAGSAKTSAALHALTRALAAWTLTKFGALHSAAR